MNTQGLVIGIHPIAVLDDDEWDDRIDVIIEDVRQEEGALIYYATPAHDDIDVLFILYPPNQHKKIYDERSIENFLNSRDWNISVVQVIACGRNVKGSRVDNSDIRDIVNDQCASGGYKSKFHRALRPEDLDVGVKPTILRAYRHRLHTVPESQFMQNVPLAPESTTVSAYEQPDYESDDL